MIIHFIIISILAYLAYEDFRYLSVDSYIVYIVVSLCFLCLTLNNLPSVFLSFGICILMYFHKNLIGQADVILLTALTCTISVVLIPYFFLIVSLINLSFHAYIKNMRIPMIPSIAISYSIIMFYTLCLQ